jgi:NTE family protein
MTLGDEPQSRNKLVLLRRLPVFGECTDKQLAFIAERTRLVEYKKGEVIYREGAAADALYIVVSGRLRVYTSSPEGEAPVAVLHNGDSFGEISLLTGETHSASVQALNDALVLELGKRDFEAVIDRVPSLVLSLSRSLSKRLRTTMRSTGQPEATIVAIYAAVKGIGRTLFATALAAALARQRGPKVVVIDMVPGQGPSLLRGPEAKSVAAAGAGSGALAEAQIAEALTLHPLGFHVLSVGGFLAEQEGDQAVAPLLSELTKRFGYVLLDLPVETDAQVLKALVQADVIYMLTDQRRDTLLQTKALIDRVQDAIGFMEPRVKVIVNRLPGLGLHVSPSEIGQTLKAVATFVLPTLAAAGGQPTREELSRHLEDVEVDFGRAMARIGRDLSGTVIGLALGSGAALGLAHIGVLKVIEREKIPIDVIAGTSIGSLVAGLWAAGRSAQELEQMALRFRNPWDIRRLFVLDLGIPVLGLAIGVAAGLVMGMLSGAWTTGVLFGFVVSVGVAVVLGPLSGGPIQGAVLMRRLEQDFAGKTFDDTWLPLKIVAANPMAREEVVFSSGPLAEAVRASVSIPGIFKPVVRIGQVCLDGGVVNPVPVSVLRRSGANRIIAVNVFSTVAELQAEQEARRLRRQEREAQIASRPLPVRLWYHMRREVRRSAPPMIFDVIMRSMQFMEYQIAEVACHEADLTLRPTVPGAHWLEFFAPEKFIRRGEEVALQHLPQLKRLAGLAGE